MTEIINETKDKLQKIKNLVKGTFFIYEGDTYIIIAFDSIPSKITVFMIEESNLIFMGCSTMVQTVDAKIILT